MKRAVLTAAAHRVISAKVDHFPPLIIYLSLAGNPSLLADATEAHLNGEIGLLSETVSFPRKGFAPRPVEVLSGASLAAYSALVTELQPALPQPSRAPGAWATHQEFGLSGDLDSYIVDIDYTACYELIDHEDLRKELLLRSFNVDTVANLSRLLTGIGRRGRGLPQMLAESDILADTYLNVVDRSLERSGYKLHRYADDMRIVTPDWTSALLVIEETARLARDLGLLLSSAKTSIRRRETLVRREDEVSQILTTRIRGMSETGLRNSIHTASNPYEDEDEEGNAEGEETPNQEQTDQRARKEAYRAILQDWHAQFLRRTSLDPDSMDTSFAPHLNVALAQMRDHDEDLTTDLLNDLVFEDESRIEHVVKYLIARRGAGTGDFASTSFSSLLENERHTVWSKLWLLFGAMGVFQGGSMASPVSTWVANQLQDDSEILRAQAAWTLANFGELSTKHLQDCYLRASFLSAPALAAAAGLQAKTDPILSTDSVIRAVREDNDLNKEAFKWAQM